MLGRYKVRRSRDDSVTVEVRFSAGEVKAMMRAEFAAAVAEDRPLRPMWITGANYGPEILALSRRTSRT